MNQASPSRGLRIVLIASLCLNLVFIGAGAAVAARWHAHPQEQLFKLALRQVTRHLDRDDARVMRRSFLGHAPRIVAAQAEYRQSLKAAVSAMQESPRNDDKLQAAIGDARAKRIAAGDLAFDALVEGLQDISPAGREALLKAAP